MTEIVVYPRLGAGTGEDFPAKLVQAVALQQLLRGEDPLSNTGFHNGVTYSMIVIRLENLKGKMIICFWNL